MARPQAKTLDSTLRRNPGPASEPAAAPPSHDFPVLMMPVRLETRFVEKQLLVRIFPDQLAIETHEHDLTAEEVIGGRTFRQRFDSGDAQQKHGAFRDLARRFGPRRAAWIARQVDTYDGVDPQTLGRDSWKSAPTTRVLPDKFLISIYKDGRHVAEYDTISTVPVPRELGIVRSPAERKDGAGKGERATLFDEAARWVTDFDAAIETGMAVKINLRDDYPPPFSHVIAVGLNAALEPAAAARLLEEVLDGHHYKGGMAFVPYGTPTNNTAHGKSGHSSEEDLDHAYDVELGKAEADDDRSNGLRLRRALGLPAATKVFAHVEHAADKHDSHAQEMQELLWPATGGLFLGQLLDGVVPKEEIGRAREHFVRYVRARGPLPTLRIGKLPYGFLPVTRLDRWGVMPGYHQPEGWEPRTADSAKLGGDPAKWSAFDDHLHSMGVKLRRSWLERAHRADLVPRMGQGDPDAELLAVLGMEARSVSYRLQPQVEEQFVGVLLAAVRERFFANAANPEQAARAWLDHWQRSKMGAFQLLQWLGAQPAKASAARLLQMLAWGQGEPAEAKLLDVDPTPYLNALYEKGEDAAVTSEALFPKLLHCSFQVDPDPDRLQEILGRLLGKPAIEVLNQALSTEELAAYLERPGRREDGLPKGSARQVAKKALAARKALPEGRFANPAQAAGAIGADPASVYAVDFDGLLRDSLDLFSHRLEAWMTSLATKRLEAMRERKPFGVHLGAYGWVEDLSPVGATPGQGRPAVEPGFIHAPSLGQASAAAVMRSVFLHHERGGPRNPFCIDLTSDRVRRGMHLLDGVREGQPLGALLGYQFERALHDAALDKHIDPIRHRFPLVPPKEIGAGPGEARESVAARNVVDGLALARARDDTVAKILPPDPDGKTIAGFVDDLRDALNASSDLLMTEAVYHSVKGNFDRAGAALDAAAGHGPPPQLDCIYTPTSGISLRQRVCAIFPAAAPRSDAGPRAAAEPQLDAWFGSLIGDLNSIGCWVSFGFLGRAKVLLGKRPTKGPADGIWLDLDPLDLLYMSALPPSGEETQLEARIKFHVRAAKALARDAPVRLELGRSDVRSVAEAVEVGRAVLALLGSAAYLRPDGLCRIEEAPADPFARIKLDELEARVTAAQTALQNVVDLLLERRSDAALLTADLFGIQGAMPPAPGEDFHPEKERQEKTKPATQAEREQLHVYTKELANRRATVADDAKKRLAKSRQLDDEAAGKPAQERVGACILALQALFGGGFVVLPRFELAGDQLAAALKQNGRLGADADDRVMLWLQQVAETHPAVRKLESALMVQQAWGSAPMRLRVGQLPYCEHRPWQALSDAEIAELRGDAKGAEGDCVDPPKGRPRGITSIVALAPDPAPSGSVAGLMIDQWSETVPFDQVTTGLALHYDAPATQAPQAVLLAVPARHDTSWTPHQLRDIVRDTADLVRMRLVDPDALGELDEPGGGARADATGHSASEHDERGPLGFLLPALFMPFEPAPDPELERMEQLPPLESGTTSTEFDSG